MCGKIVTLSAKKYKIFYSLLRVNLVNDICKYTCNLYDLKILFGRDDKYKTIAGNINITRTGVQL